MPKAETCENATVHVGNPSTMLTVNCCFCANRKVLSLRNEKKIGALNHIGPKQEGVQAPLMPEPACGN